MTALRAMRDREGLTLPDVAVFTMLALRANEVGECWPSYERIAQDARVSRRTAIAAVDRLVAAGLVRRTVRARGSAVNAPNRYAITVRRWCRTITTRCRTITGVVINVHPGWCSRRTGVVINVHPKSPHGKSLNGRERGGGNAHASARKARRSTRRSECDARKPVCQSPPPTLSAPSSRTPGRRDSHSRAGRARSSCGRSASARSNAGAVRAAPATSRPRPGRPRGQSEMERRNNDNRTNSRPRSRETSPGSRRCPSSGRAPIAELK